MSLIISLIIGGVIGWAAAKLLGREEGILASVVIGIVGAIIGGWLSVLTTGSNHAYLALSWSSVIWSFIGALILVVIMNAFQHRSHHHA